MIRSVFLIGALSMALPGLAKNALVVHVSDGDTIVVLDGLRNKATVRLAHIDAPESGRGTCRPGQPWSSKSTTFLASLIKGKSVRLQCVAQDRYGRSVCDVMLGDTTASRLLVREGLAWANRARPEYLGDAAVAKEEAAAKASGKGLWSDPGATAPWLWRKHQWDTSPSCKTSYDRERP